MLNHIRLVFIALFASLFLVACGDESTSEQAAETAPAATEAAAMKTSNVVDEGMTEEQAVAKFGEPTIKQTHSIDALTIAHYEWHNKDGITSIQFQNGKAKYSQFIPAE